jgi:hypothetical protein
MPPFPTFMQAFLIRHLTDKTTPESLTTEEWEGILGAAVQLSEGTHGTESLSNEEIDE